MLSATTLVSTSTLAGLLSLALDRLRLFEDASKSNVRSGAAISTHHKAEPNSNLNECLPANALGRLVANQHMGHGSCVRESKAYQ
ncbi:hypothetical protein OH76DRAFT_1407615 [Lentinus brumalis]|uniref:Secreted protein n=1 Tax=Lentinus brumalis TaxID=2498619 RepID=A0A371CZW3_9APHY|nr:hypothetical protein OH76DRAFT_1407615 [Polyporus brumalis]